MGFRYRKSINLGDGFRINLSKSGIGYSFGVKGARITKKANGGIRTTLSIPNTGLSYVSETGKAKRTSQTKNLGKNKYATLLELGEKAYANSDYKNCVKYCVECIYLFDKNNGDLVNDKAFLVAAKAYDKLEMHKCVIDVCNLAIAHNLKDGTKGSYEGRKTRAENKLKKTVLLNMDYQIEFSNLMKDADDKHRAEESAKDKQETTSENIGCMIAVVLVIVLAVVGMFFSCTTCSEESNSDYTNSNTGAITARSTTTSTTTSTIKTTSSTETTSRDEIIVYWAGGDAEVYHRDEWCSNIKNPKEITLGKVEKKGLRACKKCYG